MVTTTDSVLRRGVAVDGDVGDNHDELGGSILEVPCGRDDVAEALADGVGQDVVVGSQQGQSPEPVPSKGLLRLERVEELLQLVQPVLGAHGADEGTRRRPEDDGDASPQVAVAKPLEEAELQQHGVHAAAREDDGHIPIRRRGPHPLGPLSASFV